MVVKSDKIYLPFYHLPESCMVCKRQRGCDSKNTIPRFFFRRGKKMEI